MKTKRKQANRGIRGIIFSCVTAGLLFVPIMMNVLQESDVDGISRACRNSAECMSAVQKEKDAKQQASNASASASLYQAKVNELNASVARMEQMIESSEKKINAIIADIEAQEKELDKKQEALVEELVNMYVEGDTDAVDVIAGSSSFAEIVEKQVRADVVRQRITESLDDIKKIKADLEQKKADLEDTLAQQKQTKIDLNNEKAEKQNLVAKYQNDAAAYEQVAKDALEAQRIAEQKEQEAHPERYGGSAYTGYNTYPWQGDCPGMQDAYGTIINGSYIGGYVCECVSYVGWKAYEAYGLYLAWGNAYSWDEVARSIGYRVDHTPEVDSSGQVDGYPYGHVFWVEEVNADGSINVTEYNNAYATQLYSGSFHYGDFGARHISASEVSSYNYIHLK